MRKERFIAALSFALLFGAVGWNIWADDLETSKRLENVEPILVTATRVETPVSHLTQSYTLIDCEEISQRREGTVLEVLRDVPGLEIVRNGTQGANATAFLRGASSAQTLVLIDGVEVNAPNVGSFDFGHLMTDNVDRIEIIRGPQSALYGSEAMGGVINIITKRGQGKPKVTLDTYGGSDQTGSGLVMASGAQGPFDYALSSSYLTTDGEFDNDGYDHVHVTGNLGYSPSEKFRVELITRALRANKEIQDFGRTIPDPNRSLRTESQLTAIKADHWIADGWEHQLTLSWVHDRLFDKDPLNPAEIGLPMLSRITDEIRTVEWQHHFFWGDIQTLTAGIEYEDSQGRNITTGDSLNSDFHFKKDVHNLAFYFQDQLNFWDRLFIVPGVRVDDHSLFDTQVSPKVSGAFWILSQTKLKASWGEGFRAPSVNELVFPNFGNPNLDAETSKGWEAGLEQTFFDHKAGLDFAYFQNNYDDLIDFETISIDPFVGRANNISKASIDGLEISGFVKPWAWMTLRGSWTHLDAQNDITGKPLARRPDDAGSLGVSFFWQKFTLAADVTLMGSRPDFGTELAGFVKVDLALSYQWNDHIMPYVKIQNLLDDNYEEASGFPAPGILAYGGVKAEF